MKDGELIATFNHNNKNFKLIYKEHKLMCLCHDENGNSYFKLSDEEKEVLISVVKSLRVDEKKSCYVRDEYVNGRLYKIYYDSKTRNYFWKSDENVEILNDNIYLNKKYNHIPSVVYFWHRPRTYEEKLDRQLRNLFKDRAIKDLDNIYDNEDRIHMKEIYIKHGKKERRKRILINSTVNLLLLLSIPFMNHIFVVSMEQIHGEDWKKIFSDFTINETIATEHAIPNYSEAITEALEYTIPNYLEEPNEIVIEIPEQTDIEEEKEEYSWELIRGAIERNPNLTDKEKSFLYELRFVFDENHQYMDLELVVSRLETLRITYNSGICPYDPDVGGHYFTDERNMIENFNASSFDEVDIAVFLHEFFHALQRPSNFHLTTELSNELFTREALRRLHTNGVLDKFNIKFLIVSPGYYKYGVGYDNWINMYYDLAGIIPRDALCEYQFQCDEKILVNGLCMNSTSVESDRETAWHLLDNINDSRDKFSKLTGSISEELAKDIYDMTDYFYRLNGTSLSQNADHMAMSLPFNVVFSGNEACFLLEHLGKEWYLEHGDCLMFHAGTQMKSYFSDAFPNTTIYLEFSARGPNFDYGLQLLKNNKDCDVSYTIDVDEEFKQEYTCYVTKIDPEHKGR